MKWKKLLLLLPLIFFLAACSNSANKMETKQSSIFQVAEVEKCRVTAPNSEVRSGPGESFDTLGSVNQDDELDVIGQIGDWYVIQLDNNQVGCIDSAKTTPIVDDANPPTPSSPDQEIQQPQAQLDQPTAPNTNPPSDENPSDRLTDVESEMVQLVNSERRKNNLPPLKVNLEVTRVARIKSQDMVDNNYFSHYSPTYGSPFDMMRSFGINFLTAGENIAANNSVTNAHNGLMNSSGHRRNILNPNFTDVGIGIKRSDQYGYIFTQMFIGKPE